MLTKTTDKIQWYIIRKRGKRSWAAYELTDGQFNNLQSCYEAKGPYRSLIVCMIKANE